MMNDFFWKCSSTVFHLKITNFCESAFENLTVTLHLAIQWRLSWESFRPNLRISYTWEIRGLFNNNKEKNWSFKDLLSISRGKGGAEV